MVVYEVTAVVDLELCDVYETFMLDRHIPQLMATGRFTTASFDRSEDGLYRIRYEAATGEDLKRYLADDAPSLRRDFSVHFPTGIELSREEWTVLKRFA